MIVLLVIVPLPYTPPPRSGAGFLGPGGDVGEVPVVPQGLAGRCLVFLAEMGADVVATGGQHVDDQIHSIEGPFGRGAVTSAHHQALGEARLQRLGEIVGVVELAEVDGALSQAEDAWLTLEERAPA